MLFDEIEKAHPDVFNILLQVLDDGRLTDNKGRMVNFKNTIIIMTSNLGSQYIQGQFAGITPQNRDHVISDTKAKVMEMLKKTIRPEFLNRIDETIMFLPLTKAEIAQVVTLQMNAVKKMLEPQGFTLNVTPAAIDFLANEGFDPEFGYLVEQGLVDAAEAPEKARAVAQYCYEQARECIEEAYCRDNDKL